MTERETLLERRRDDYGSLRITENRYGYRLLYFGELTEQSRIYPPNPAWLDYEYSRAMLLGCYWVGAGADMTLLGLGAGALANCLVKYCEPREVKVIELRAEVVNLAREWLSLSDDPRLNIQIGCAADYLADSYARSDLLCVDLYNEGGVSRLQLQADFFLACQRSLRPGGVLVINQWQMGRSGLPYAAALLREIFGEDHLQVVVDEGNVIVFVPAAGDPPLTLDKQAMTAWAEPLGDQLGYSLEPYIEGLQPARDSPIPTGED